MPASASAIAANSPSRNVLNRGCVTDVAETSSSVRTLATG